MGKVSANVQSTLMLFFSNGDWRQTNFQQLQHRLPPLRTSHDKRGCSSVHDGQGHLALPQHSHPYLAMLSAHLLEGHARMKMTMPKDEANQPYSLHLDLLSPLVQTVHQKER